MTDWVRRVTPQNGWHLRRQLFRIAPWVFGLTVLGAWWLVTRGGDPAVRAVLPWIVALFLAAVVAPFLVPVALFVRGAELDAGFVPFGIRGHTWMLGLREWHGTVDGRALDATYGRGARALTLAIAASSSTKVAIRRGDVLGAWAERVGLRAASPPRDPELAGVWVDADEPEWAERLLSDPDALGAVRDLLGGALGREGRCLYVRPTVVELVRRSFDRQRAAGEMVGHVAALGRLAAAIERQAAPTRLRTENAYVRAYRRAPGFFGLAGSALGVAIYFAWSRWRVP